MSLPGFLFPKSLTPLGSPGRPPSHAETRTWRSHLLHKPVGISAVVPIILGHGQAAQGHQGPLHGCQVFACGKGGRAHFRAL